MSVKIDYDQVIPQVHELLAKASNLPFGDMIAVHGVVQRMNMVIAKVYGNDSVFLKDLININFEFDTATHQETAFLQETTWERSRGKLGNLCKVIMEDLQTSSFQEFVQSSQSVANSNNMSKSTDHQYSITVFISHSAKDEMLAKALVELLRAALNIPANKIRCTSVNGYRLPGGASIQDQLRQEVHESQAFIGLITPSSMASTFVLFELGARWGAGCHLVPLLGTGADSNFLRGPLSTLNGLTCDDAGQIHQLIDELANLLLITDKTSPAGYQVHVDRLMEASKARPAQRQLKRLPGHPAPG